MDTPFPTDPVPVEIRLKEQPAGARPVWVVKVDGADLALHLVRLDLYVTAGFPGNLYLGYVTTDPERPRVWLCGPISLELGHFRTSVAPVTGDPDRWTLEITDRMGNRLEEIESFSLSLAPERGPSFSYTYAMEHAR